MKMLRMDHWYESVGGDVNGDNPRDLIPFQSSIHSIHMNTDSHN